MTEQEIRDGVAARTWFHVIHLPHDIVTPGTREPDAWQMYKMPDRLDGKKVLDIGAWEGQFSFEAERRGAEEVIAMDVWDMTNEPGSIGLGWENFQFCHRALNSKVEWWNKNVYQLGRTAKTDDGLLDLPPRFDYVFFLEVLYHLQNPILGLQNVAAVCKDTLILETWIDACWVEQPAMMFYEGKELNGDPTNWWGPNQACVEAMLRTVGFKSVEMVWSRNDVHFDGRGKRACFHAKK